MKRRNRSKLLTWVIVGITTLLSGYAIYSKLEGAAVAFWSTGIPSAIALYANKQYQDRKWGELNKEEVQDTGTYKG